MGLSRKLRKKAKVIINKVYGLVQRRPAKVIGVTVDNVDQYYGGRQDVSYVIRSEDSGNVAFEPSCIKEHLVSHFKSFQSLTRVVLLKVKHPEFQFNSNYLLDNFCNVVYQPGINLHQLNIGYKYLKKTKKINGTIAYLSNSNVSNYGHWFQYAFPLLRFYWDLLGRDKIDYYYIGDVALTAFQKESLQLAGISSDQLITFPCRGDEVVMAIKQNPVQHGYAKFNDLGTFNFLQEIFKSYRKAADTPRKIYVGRGKVSYRKVLNEDWLTGLLSANGFEIISMDGLTLKEQALLFYNADSIIAPHGSALTNIMFCKPGTRLLELFPYQYKDWFNVSFAACGKLDYYYYYGNKANADNNPAIYNDILIDPEGLRKFLSDYGWLGNER